MPIRNKYWKRSTKTHDRGGEHRRTYPIYNCAACGGVLGTRPPVNSPYDPVHDKYFCVEEHMHMFRLAQRIGIKFDAIISRFHFAECEFVTYKSGDEVILQTLDSIVMAHRNGFFRLNDGQPEKGPYKSVLKPGRNKLQGFEAKQKIINV